MTLQEKLHAAYVNQVAGTEHWVIDTMIPEKEQAQIRLANLKKGLWTMRDLTTIKITDMSDTHIHRINFLFGGIIELINEQDKRAQLASIDTSYHLKFK